MQYQDYDYGTDSDAAPWTASAPAVAPAPANAQMMPLPVNTPIVVSSNPAAPSASDMMALGSMLRSIQQTQVQQTYMLRDMDTRITRIEVNRQSPPSPQVVVAPGAYERATWWALWGLLMLILGGALTVVIILILLNVQFK